MTCIPNKLRIALIQMRVEANKLININHAKELIDGVKTKGVNLVALGECFNSPYGTDHFPENAESIPDGPTCKMLSEAAKRNSMFIVGGTIPEVSNRKYYNTCTVWNPAGEMIAKYRKMHLFDIDIPGKITFKESDVLSAGNELVTFNVNGAKIGIGICYDLRFEELAKLYRKDGCHVIVYPGSFNMTTGPIHWELLQRSRALDNQLFVCTISPARNTSGYISYGHSAITNPWGAFTSLKADEDVLCKELDFDEMDTARKNIPIFSQRRSDIYDTVKKNTVESNKTDGDCN